jgi:hypothetical protein
MARKLKTYQTSLGFFDLAVAAPSMKAALEGRGAPRERPQQDPARVCADDPAPAMTSRGAPTCLLAVTPCSTARRCSGLSVPRYDAAVVASTNCPPVRTPGSVILRGTAMRLSTPRRHQSLHFRR